MSETTEHYQAPADMDETIHLSEYLDVLKKRKWLIIVIALLTLFAAGLASFLMKPVYEAKAVLVIDKQQTASPVTGEKLDYETYQSQQLTFNTHFKLIKSKPVLTQVMYALHLDEEKDNQELEVNLFHKLKSQLKANVKLLLGMEEKQPPTEEERLDAILATLSRSISIQATRDTRLLTVSVKNTDPALAQRIANELAKKYIEFDVSNKLDASQSNLKWMHNELYALKKKLEDDEREFLDYRKLHNVFSLEGKQKVIDQKISEFNNEYLAARNRRLELDAKLAEIERQYGGSGNIIAIRSMVSNDTVRTLYSTLTGLEVEYNKLSKVYKAKHPKIVQVNGELAKVQKKLTTELERELENLKTERSVLHARETLMQQNIAEFEKDALDAGSKELRFTILKRNVDTNQSLYDTLLAKVKESAMMSSGSASNIRIVENASLPTAPVKPDKRRNILLGFVLGLFGGIGLAFVLEYFDQSVHTEEDVEKHFGLAVLSVVPEADRGKSGSYGGSN